MNGFASYSIVSWEMASKANATDFGRCTGPIVLRAVATIVSSLALSTEQQPIKIDLVNKRWVASIRRF